MRQRAKQRNAVSNDYRHASDGNSMNQARPHGTLNRDASVEIDMFHSGSFQPRDDFRGLSTHLLHDSTAHAGEIDCSAAEYDDMFSAVGPFGKGQYSLEGLAADHQSVDAREELVITVRLAAIGRQKIEISVRSCDKA